LFPFGFGLTYTTFKYSNLKVESEIVNASTAAGFDSEGHRIYLTGKAGAVRVSADIGNTGKREGTEVVQLYVHDRLAPTSRPVRELKGFQRITLGPGEHKQVEFSVNANDLGSHDPQMHWIVPASTYDVWVASDSASGIQGTFEVK
jgi:beta-glucosidase